MIEPHGGQLINRMADGRESKLLKSDVVDEPTIDLNPNQCQDLLNISSGRYSPLNGFMTQHDFVKVLKDRTLEDGTTWPLPIVLDVGTVLATDMDIGDWVGLRSPTGELVGKIEIADIYEYNPDEAVTAIFGTDDSDHPGVQRFYDREEFFVGGPVRMFEYERSSRFDLSPEETRVLFEHHDWDTVVGFQTRNAPHRAHEYIQKSALEHLDGLLVQPKIGDKKVGDYRNEVIIEAYQTLLDNYYPEARTALSVFPSKMNYAGPREAVFDAIVRKNHGCTHFIVGRDHAGVGDYYDGYASQRIFSDVGDLGITPLFYTYSFYCNRCDGMASEHTCPHDDKVRVHPSGTEIRELITSGSLPSEKMMRSEVASQVSGYDQPFVEEPSIVKEKI